MSSFTSPYSQTAQDILRDLIYARNGFMLPDTGVIYGTPQSVAPLVADPYQRDTLIEVSMDPSIPNSLISGCRTVFYKRWLLSELIAVSATPTPIAVVSYPTSAYALLDQINAYYGLSLTQVDIVDTVYASATAAVLTATPGALLYEGALTLNLEAPATPVIVTPS